MAKKVIVTIEFALKKKYGPNFTALQNLFNSLIVSDAAKGLTTTVVYIDTPAAAALYSYPLPALMDEAACKTIVDQIYWKDSPEYIAIFGAQDIFPFQHLVNQLHRPGVAGSDPDKLIPSDLPYACDSPYSIDCNTFTNPTRAVGRIPDMPLADNAADGNGDIDYVSVVIEQIKTSTPIDAATAANRFAISAGVWVGSTQTSLRNIFGNAMGMKISPPSISGSYTPADIAPPNHFFNLHGALGRAIFYGQQGSNYPPALQAQDLFGRVSAGTFVAAECCYGAQLLPVSQARGIASVYLQNKASVFMGSSTISYGPAVGNDLADLICQYFTINILNGASSGSALLSARQRFLTVSGPALNFHELKTLAQFYILGDPSVHPVKPGETIEQMGTIEDRRFTMQAKGIILGNTIPNTQVIGDVGPTDPLKEFPMLAGLKEYGIADAKTIFEVDGMPTGNFLIGHNFDGGNLAGEQKIRYHVYQKGTIFDSGICNMKALVVKERGGQFMSYREYLCK